MTETTMKHEHASLDAAAGNGTSGKAASGAATAGKAASGKTAVGKAASASVSKGKCGAMSTGYKVALVVAIVLSVAAVAAWGSQMTNGLVETGMRSFTPWGLGIIGFMFFVGLSAGSLACGAYPWALNLERFKPLSLAALWTSFACAAGAVVAIMADLGQPFRAFEMIYRGNMASPLMGDMIALTLYAVVLIVLMVMVAKGSGAARGTAWVALVMMVVLQVVEAGIFCSYGAHAYWATPLMYPWFIVTALACGAGLVAIVAAVLVRAHVIALDEGAARGGMRFLGVCVLIDLAFLLIDVAVSAASGSSVPGMLVGGVLAPFFWCQVVCYVVAIVLGLRGKPQAAIAAGVLAIVGAFCKRCCLLLGGFQVPNLSDEGTLTAQMLTNYGNGMKAAFSSLVYVPTVPEVCLFVGTIGIVLLFILVGLRLLPIKSTKA